MPNYTLKNFKTDITDGAAERGMSPDIESRMARSSLDSTELGVSYFRYGPGFRAPFGHNHIAQEEAYVVVEGSGKVKLDERVEDLKQWDVLRVAPDVVRGFEGGPEGLTLIAVGGRRAPEGDGQMVSDWWTD